MKKSIKYHKNESNDESLLETIEILSDPEIMRDIAKGIEDYNKGKFKTLSQIKREIH